METSKVHSSTSGLGVLAVAVPIIAIIAGASWMIFSMGWKTRTPTPEQLALVTEAAPELDLTSAAFCADPGPIADALPLSDSVGNAAVVHERIGSRWNRSSYDALAPGTWAGDAWLADEGTEEVRAVVCLERVADGDERSCGGYSGGARATVWSYDTHGSVYEAATGEMIGSFDIDGGVLDLTCPMVIAGDDAYLPGELSDAQITRKLAPILAARPSRYDVVSALTDGDWCRRPVPLVASSSEAVIVTGWSDEVNLSEAALDWSAALPSHVVCVDLYVNGELSCHGDTSKLRIGDLALSVVDATTGSVVAETTLPTSQECGTARSDTMTRPGPEALSWIAEQVAVVSGTAEDVVDVGEG